MPGLGGLLPLNENIRKYRQGNLTMPHPQAASESEFALTERNVYTSRFVRVILVQGPCCEARDEVKHYLECPILWQFARETLHLQEYSILIGERLCLINPSIPTLKLLAFCHTLYHACKNDKECVQSDGGIQQSLIVQNRASDISRFVRHLV